MERKYRMRKTKRITRKTKKNSLAVVDILLANNALTQFFFQPFVYLKLKDWWGKGLIKKKTFFDIPMLCKI